MGMIFKAPGFLIWLVAGFWGLWISASIVHDIGGSVLVVISLLLAPFLLGLAPWYAGLFLGDWFPLLLIYGGGIAGMVLFAIGSAIDGD